MCTLLFPGIVSSENRSSRLCVLETVEHSVVALLWWWVVCRKYQTGLRWTKRGEFRFHGRVPFYTVIQTEQGLELGIMWSMGGWLHRTVFCWEDVQLWFDPLAALRCCNTRVFQFPYRIWNPENFVRFAQYSAVPSEYSAAALHTS